MNTNEQGKWAEKQLTQEQAIELAKSEVWKYWDFEQKVRFQLFQRRLCMPFDVFHEAIEKVLGRPVWTHEFINHDSMVLEYLGEKPAPTFDEICDMIPAEKRIILNF